MAWLVVEPVNAGHSKASSHCIFKMQIPSLGKKSDVTNCLATNNQLIGRCHKPSVVILTPHQKPSTAIRRSVNMGSRAQTSPQMVIRADYPPVYTQPNDNWLFLYTAIPSRQSVEPVTTYRPEQKRKIISKY